jgi:RHS repeat-associated protein
MIRLATPNPHPAHLLVYNGQHCDPETPLHFDHTRHYDPPVGRWLNEEPVGYTAADADLYRYVVRKLIARYHPVFARWPQETNVIRTLR